MDDMPIFPGLGQQLSGVLHALDIKFTLEPVWTLKQTSGKIYLDIVWTKVKFPATRTETKPAARVAQQGPRLRQTDREIRPKIQRTNIDQRASISAANPGLTKKQKHKSPSTRKRDKQRREKWLSQKRSSSCKNRHKPPSDPIQRPVGVNVCTTSVIDSATDNPTGSNLSRHTQEPTPTTALSRAETPRSTTENRSPSGSSIRRRRLLPTPPTLKPQRLSLHLEQTLLPSPTSSPPRGACGFTPRGSSASTLQPDTTDLDTDSDDYRCCSNCFAYEVEILPEKLKKCTRCCTTLYCNRDCQAKHWEFTHRTVCRPTSPSPL